MAWIIRLLLIASLGPATGAAQPVLQPVTAEAPAGQALVDRLRQGGLVLFFRHADTSGEPCDSSFRIGDRAGQRNISAVGQAQARRIGEALAAIGIPIAWPALAGPVFRARDTAELAFGADRVRVTDSLLADDYAGGRLGWLVAEHRRLFGETPPAGTNRVLVGHRTPAIMVVGEAMGGRAFPEGAALVLAPQGAGQTSSPAGAAQTSSPQGAAQTSSPQGAAQTSSPQGAAQTSTSQGDGFTVLGILMLAPIPGGGFHRCQ